MSKVTESAKQNVTSSTENVREILSKITEIDMAGNRIRDFSPADSTQWIQRYYSDQTDIWDIVTDSANRLIAVDRGICLRRSRVLLLNSRLEVERVLIDEETDELIGRPLRLYYDELAGQLIVCGRNRVCGKSIAHLMTVQIFRIR